MKLEKKDLLYLVAFIVAILMINPVLQVVSGTSTPLAVVRGTSMLPLLREGDIVFLIHKDPEEIKVGDVIVYRSLRGHLIIHRVIEIIRVGGELEFVTKGDNNPRDDSFLFEFPPGRGVTFDRIVGVVWEPKDMILKIPYIGVITLIVKG